MAQRTTDNNRNTNNRPSSRQPGSGRQTGNGRQSGGARSSGNGSGRSASSPAARPAERRQTQDDDQSREVIYIVVTLAVALFLTLCNFGLCGKFGSSVARIFFGTFGFWNYIAPLFFAFMIVRGILLDGRDSIYPIRVSGAVSIFLMFGVFADIKSGVSAGLEKYDVGSLYRLSGEGKCGGGVLAGSISYALLRNLGKFGTVLICLLIILLGLFMINRSFFAKLIRDSFSAARDRSGEVIRNSSARVRERARISEKEETLYLPLSDEEPVAEETQDAPAAAKEALTVTEKMKSARAPEKKPALSSVSAGLENWKNNARKRSEEDKLRKQEEKKVRSETEDARDILKAEKIKEHGRNFEVKHTGEMHEMSYREDLYYPEEEPAEDNVSGTWYDPSRRPGGNTAEMPNEPEEEFLPDETETAGDNDDEPEFERVFEGSDHKIKFGNAPDVEEEIPEAEDIAKPEESIRVKEPVKKADTVRPSAAPASPTSAATPAAPAASVRQTPPKKAAGKFVYKPPSTDLLKKSGTKQQDAINEIRNVQTKLIETLSSFGIDAKMGEYSQGPTVTRYEFTVSQGTKLSRIVGLSDEIKMALAATDIRIEAPIPGKSAIGIEVPNSSATPVFFGDLITSQEYRKSQDPLSFSVGKDIEGKAVVANIAKFPHVLIAGTTGSGKSVCINTLILSLLYKSSPEDVQLILVDPKVVELKVYNKIPHLPFDVVTKPKAASEMLKWSVEEMERRYRLFADRGVRDIEGYNTYVREVNAGEREPAEIDERRESDSLAPALRKLPRIVIIIDELADLMMVAAKEVEESICRLAQLARAAGMHLVVATQRPSVDVITGLIKANMPSRIAFAVSSGVDSRTILDQVGAEKLLGKGDMLFYPQGRMKPDRLQGAFVSDEEVGKVTGYLRAVANDPSFRNPLADADGIEDLKKRIKDIEAGVDPSPQSSSSSQSSGGAPSVFGDDLFEEAGRYIIRSGKASIGYLQRVLKIGFNRAARIMDYLAEYGVVGPEQGTKPREILMTEEMFTAMIAQKTGSEEE